MAIAMRRYLHSFTNQVGGNSFEFPEYDREWSSKQGYSTPVTTAVGADYGYDHLGSALSQRQPAVESVRFLIIQRSDVAVDHPHALPVDAQLDAMYQRLHANGHGRLWMRLEDSDSWRWANARMTARPDTSFGGRVRQMVPVSLEFARLSDWFAEDATVLSQNVTASPTTLEVTNAGTLVARGLTVEVRSLGTNGYINPIITNTITGEWFQLLRTGSNSNHRFRVDTRRYRIERSTDGGTTWTDDYASLTTGVTQAGLLSLATGDNFLTVSQPSGTPNMNVSVSFHAPYQ